MSLSERPIPDHDGEMAAKEGYRAHSFETEHPLAAEALLDARAEGLLGRNYYAHADNPPYYQKIPGAVDEIYLRPELVDRLKEADQIFATLGYRLFLSDGWRPQAVQRHFHDEWFPAQVRTLHPEWTDEHILRETETYWARPASSEKNIDPLSPPPHSTGAAADLFLIDASGNALPMGSELEEGTIRSHMDHLEKHDSDSGARANRRLLYHVLTSLGLVGNPTEWWHWSLGDQMWARLTQHRTGVLTSARYSNQTPPGF